MGKEPEGLSPDSGLVKWEGRRKIEGGRKASLKQKGIGTGSSEQ